MKVINSNNDLEFKDIIFILSDSGYMSLLEYEIMNDINDSYIQDPIIETRKIKLCLINKFKISNYGFDYRNPIFFIRTDPLSRSLCISSFVNSINIWNINSSISENKFEMDNSTILNENGTIIDLIYLYPFQDDLNKIILVALICSEEKVYIVSYSFDNSDNLKCKSNFKSVPFLDATQSMPIQIIALPQFPECFIILTEQDVYFFKLNVLVEQNIYCSKINLMQYIRNNDVVISTVTTYDDFPGYITKDMNLPEYQNLLLGTNYGDAFKLTVYSNNELKIKNIINPVTISNSIYIDYYEGSDYFFSSGEMSDGYIFSVNKRTNELNVHDKVVDLSLLTDCVFLDYESLNINLNNNKLFVACGYQPNGFIKSIESGIKASLLSSQLLIEGIINLWTVRCKDDQYIIISFYNNTLILNSKKDKNQRENYFNIINCSDSCNLYTNCRTICAGSILNEEYLVQVVENKIIFVYCNNHSDKLESFEIVNEFVPSGNRNIFKAEIVDNYILLKYSDSKSLEIIKINNENSYLTFESLQDIQLSSEISSMKLIVKNDNLYIYVCTYEPSFSIYHYNNNTKSFKLILNEQLDVYSNDETGIPNSIEILKYNNIIDYLIIGFRNGSLLVIKTENQNDLIVVRNTFTKQLGNIPIKLYKNNYYKDNNQYIIIFGGENTYKLYLNEYGISLENVLVPKVDNIASYYHPESKNVYLIEYNKTIQIVNFDKYNKLHLKEYNISGTPKHMLFDNSSKTLVISSDTQSITNNIYSEITIMNPSNGKVYFNENYKEKGELCTKLAKWNVKNEKSYICVSMWNKNINESCVSMYNIKKIKMRSQEQIEMKMKLNSKNQMFLEKRGEIKIPGKVNCIQTLKNKYLLISSENLLYLIKINSSTKSPIISSSIKTRWKITTVNTIDNFVYVGQVNESVSLYEFNQNKKLEFKKSDEISKLVGSCITLSKNSIYVADRYGSIFGLSNKNEMIYSLYEDFNLYFGEPIMKFIKKELNNNQLQTYFNTACDNYEENKNTRISIVYGLSILGTIIKMIQIPDILYKQFMILQLIMGMYESTKPILGNDFDKYISKHRISHNIINGDMLNQFLLLNKHDQEEIVNSFNNLWKYHNNNEIISEYNIEYIWNIINDFDKSLV
ncbi:hypothetical protein BCR36DRAFT_347475 [Piromyces finnis]|uniref:RSE1/DDB1/CPSF1 first beta-propeller domain-containing protein n=1 Tax=Piromyces finnis TaxID=1754191 RepID=A0A1Y1VHF5_9FUNG|nr:hypothetical protein BCR36DRAFT_347475 [Piromyces finnis]|eukprot:ORX55513.1 hypothetical protein BCR36DRAFT_347475 [Piromyces finnis]